MDKVFEKMYTSSQSGSHCLAVLAKMSDHVVSSAGKVSNLNSRTDTKFSLDPGLQLQGAAFDH